MATYAIRIEEKIGKTVIVKGKKNLQEALEEVQYAVHSGHILLDSVDDYIETDVYPSECFPDGEVTDEADVSYYETFSLASC